MSLKRRMSRLMHNAKALSLAPYYPHMSAHAVDVAEYEARQDGARRRYEAVASGLTTAERLTGHFIRDVPITSFGDMSPARARVLEDELTKTTIFRSLLDNAALAVSPVVVTKPGGNPMASRKKAAPKRRAKITRKQAELADAFAHTGAVADELTAMAPKRPTIAEQLAAPDKPPEIEALASFVGAYFLSCAGFTPREIGALFMVSATAAGEMIQTGAVISTRQRIAINQTIGDRMRAMRENAAADWALKAAHGMQELIASALPAFIRASNEEGRPCSVDVKKVVDLVEHFSATDDVVERSNLAQRIRREMEPMNGCATGSNEGQLKQAEAYRGTYGSVEGMRGYQAKPEPWKEPGY